MTLSEALEGIYAHRFMKICGYSYRGLYHFSDLQYKDLPPRLQYGILQLINAIHRTGKMVYSYDIYMVKRSMTECGINISDCFRRAGLPETSWRSMPSEYRTRERLMMIRLELMRMVNRLFEYVLE